jgi:hypothetical protein
MYVYVTRSCSVEDSDQVPKDPLAYYRPLGQEQYVIQLCLHSWSPQEYPYSFVYIGTVLEA